MLVDRSFVLYRHAVWFVPGLLAMKTQKVVSGRRALKFFGKDENNMFADSVRFVERNGRMVAERRQGDRWIRVKKFPKR